MALNNLNAQATWRSSERPQSFYMIDDDVQLVGGSNELPVCRLHRSQDSGHRRSPLLLILNIILVLVERAVDSGLA